MRKQEIIQTIVAALQPLNPEKVVLFGSYAANEFHADSDVDLYVVSQEEFIPASYAENMRHYKKYTLPLKRLKQQIPLDVVVHTRAMNRRFEADGSSFARQILRNGERIL